MVPWQFDPPPGPPVFSPADFAGPDATIRTGLVLCGVTLAICAVGALLARWSKDDFFGKTLLCTGACVLPLGVLILIGGMIAKAVT